jgi:SAM-dependent methyltransferase
VEKKWLFDRQWTRDFTAVRQKFVAEFLAKIRPQIEHGSALDVGCGVGDFSQFLSGLGFRVVAVDGRAENSAEARKRYPNITFRTQNAEELDAAELGSFDLVLCFGLLYHLENPFRAIRQLFAATNKILLVESMCAPSTEPIMELLDEAVAEDQGLDYVAFYPSESCLVKMLYRAGFQFVYGLARPLEHELFHTTIWHKKRRTILVCSKMPITSSELQLFTEPMRSWEIWSTRLERLRSRSGRLGRLAGRLLPHRPGSSRKS